MTFEEVMELTYGMTIFLLQWPFWLQSQEESCLFGQGTVVEDLKLRSSFLLNSGHMLVHVCEREHGQ